MVNLRDLLLQPSLPNGTASLNTLPGASKPSLTEKNWARRYPPVPIMQPFYENPTRDEIDILFGREDALDAFLLNREVSPLNSTMEWLQNEGDSVRTFYTKVSEPIQLAFQPFMIQRSESGPLGPTTVNQTIDFTWGCGDRCLVIGELKRHGIIDVARWTGEVEADRNRNWLGRELRAYCHLYKCFVGAVFDGRSLLILIFQAQAVQDIQQGNCPIIGLLFSSDCETLRYGLFRTVTHQIRRMQAATAPEAIVDGYVRRYNLLTGYPYWVNGNDERDVYPVHPNGHIRKLDPSGAWYWARADGNAILDENGDTVWDTFSLM